MSRETDKHQICPQGLGKVFLHEKIIFALMLEG